MKVMRSIKVICLIFPAVFLFQCGDTFSDFFNDPDNTGTAQWAIQGKCADKKCMFNAVAVDNEGNAYAAGYISTYGEFDFGGNCKKIPCQSSLLCTVLVKYNSSGVAQWAKTVDVSVSGSSCSFNSVAVDGSGNIYAVGNIQTMDEYDFGGIRQSVKGKYSGLNTVIVKYNSNGVAQWAKTVETSSGSSEFKGVSVDEAGNAYAVGYVSGGTYSFGGLNSEVTGAINGKNAVVVKYNSSGVAQWATSVKRADGDCLFNKVAVDRLGNVYAVGTLNRLGNYSFDGTTIVSGLYDGFNVVIVKYNTAGIVQWAKDIQSASNASVYNGVAVDRSGNAYAVGTVFGNMDFDFGGDSKLFKCKSVGNNAVIVKYNSSGVAQWATPVQDSPLHSYFNSAAIDIAGNIYAVGYTDGQGLFNFGGNSISYNVNTGPRNTVIVKYNSSGVAQWATPDKDISDACFTGIAVDHSGDSYAVGYVRPNYIPVINTLSPFDFGGKSHSFIGPSSVKNTIIVKYY